MKKIVILTFVLLCSISIRPVLAAGEALFSEGNRYYADGKFEEAAKSYQALVESGVRSGALYYNLGNAYMKLGEKGRALASYERAVKYIPQDEDLFANIKFITSLLEETEAEDVAAWPVVLFREVRDALSASTWFYVALGLYGVIAGLVSIMIFRDGPKAVLSWSAGVFAVLFIVSIALFAARRSEETHARWGITVSRETDVRYSPSYSGAVAFKLYEGTKTRFIGREGDWVHIRLAKAKSGWVPGESIEEI